MSGQDLVLVVLGILLCFAGYSLFRSMLPLWGFLIGGWIVYTLLPVFFPLQAGQMLYQIIAFAVGGVIGAIISMPLYYVIIFLSGGALGMLFGILVGALIEVGGISSVPQLTTFTTMSFPPMPQTALQFILMMVFGLIMGGLAIGFQKFMICASSGFLGAAAIMSGLTGTVLLATTTDMSRSAVMLTGWLILGMLGVLLQFRMMGEV